MPRKKTLGPGEPASPKAVSAGFILSSTVAVLLGLMKDRAIQGDEPGLCKLQSHLLDNIGGAFGDKAAPVITVLINSVTELAKDFARVTMEYQAADEVARQLMSDHQEVSGNEPDNGK